MAVNFEPWNRDLKYTFTFQFSTNVPHHDRIDKTKFFLVKSICHVNGVFPDEEVPVKFFFRSVMPSSVIFKR